MWLLIPLLLVGLLVFLLGSSNPMTPAGYVGYLTRGAIFGQTSYVGLQTGPTSPGRGWLLRVTNVSVTPYTYAEDFTGENAVLSSDNLKISFRIHLVWRVRPEAVKEFIERYSTLAEEDDKNADRIVQIAYANYLREPLRTFARDEVQKHKGLEVKDNIIVIGQAIEKRVHEVIKDTPIEVRNIVVGNIQYPVEIAEAVSKKLAATQELERKNTEIEIMKREREKRIIEAEGVARAMEIINERLTGPYIQYEAIKAQKEMINSPNHTVIYIPVGNMGVPLVSPVGGQLAPAPAAVAPAAAVTAPAERPAAQRR
jgi:hypothetical protein